MHTYRKSRKSRHTSRVQARGRVVISFALTAVAALLLAVTAPGSAFAYPGPGVVTGDTRAHDPSMVKTANGTYYLYSTHNLIEMRTSTDRVNFTRTGSAFSAPLSWTSSYGTSTDLWAPDVSFHNGQYWMYYTVSKFGTNTSAIGLATSPSGAPGTWTDKGAVYTSTSSNDFNAIDGSLIVEGGRWWLSFGSFWSGIKLIQLDPATGKQLASNTTRYNLATRPSPGAVEAPYIRQANGWFYLFVSFDSCCQGTSSNYKTMVGRSHSVTGPYLDAAGTDLRSGGGLVVNETHGSTVGPGGQSVLNDTDGDLMIYHWYDSATTTTSCGCRLGVNRMTYDGNGWPVLT